jgi:hypothetical protein
LLRDITVARIFWLSQSEERKNSAKHKKWPSMIRNVSLVNGQTDRLALPSSAVTWLCTGYPPPTPMPHTTPNPNPTKPTPNLFLIKKKTKKNGPLLDELIPELLEFPQSDQ